MGEKKKIAKLQLIENIGDIYFNNGDQNLYLETYNIRKMKLKNYKNQSYFKFLLYYILIFYRDLLAALGFFD